MNMMERYIKERDIIKVKGDGNCFYRACLQSMRVKSDDKHVMRLKRKTADYIRNNGEQFDCYYDLKNQSKKAEKDGEWADHLQIKAVTIIAINEIGYNIRIWRHIGGNKYQGTNMDDSFNNGLFSNLVYNGNHYDYVLEDNLSESPIEIIYGKSDKSNRSSIINSTSIKSRLPQQDYSIYDKMTDWICGDDVKSPYHIENDGKDYGLRESLNNTLLKSYGLKPKMVI